MCKRCRGLESILILILVTFIQGLISMGPFISKFTKEIKSLRGNGVLNNNNKKMNDKTKNTKAGRNNNKKNMGNILRKRS